MANVLAFPDRLCRVLVIDADPSTAAGVRDALAKVSPRVRVHNVKDLEAAIERLPAEQWDLLILKPWQGQPGKPLPISLIRKAGYRGPVVPVTIGGPPIRRIEKAGRPARPAAQLPKAPQQKFPVKTGTYQRPSVSLQISQLLDEPRAGA